MLTDEDIWLEHRKTCNLFSCFDSKNCEFLLMEKARQDECVCSVCKKNKSIYGQFYCDDCWIDEIKEACQDERKIAELETSLDEAKSLLVLARANFPVDSGMRAKIAKYLEKVE